MGSKTLHFQTIMDDRFEALDKDKLAETNKHLVLALLFVGTAVEVGEIYPLSFEDGKTNQLRTNFYVRKSKSIKWNSVYKTINETYKPVPYRFI